MGSDRERDDLGESFVNGQDDLRSAGGDCNPPKGAIPTSIPARRGRGVGADGGYVTSTVRTPKKRRKTKRKRKVKVKATPLEMITLSFEMLHGGGTNGFTGWNKAQLAALDITWPPKKGWLKRLVGTKIPRMMYDEFLRLRHPDRSPPRQSPQQETFAFDLDPARKVCTKCGKNNVYATGGPHMDWCEPCLWAYTDENNAG